MLTSNETKPRNLFFDLSDRFASVPPALTEIVYISRRAPRLDDQGVINLIVDAAVRNFLAGVSGRLWHSREFFAQVLEGTQSTVEAFYDRIRMDTRHSDVVVVRQRRLAARRFDRPMWVFGGNDDPMMRKLLELAPDDPRDFDAIINSLYARTQSA